MLGTVRNVINGESVGAADSRTSELINPSTGEVVGAAPVSSAEDVDRAHAAAAGAFETWRDTTPSQRQALLLKAADILEAHAEELVAEMPHGGFKHSGHGKDLSMYGFEDYTRIKHVTASFT